jgi:sugar/nucleoside kinase (ribokinase family)
MLVVGGVYVDVLNEVASYPEEDSACRALSSTRRRGGNAGNSAVVLARLLAAHAPDNAVSWVGVVPSRAHPDSAFALGELARDHIDTSLLEELGAGALGHPTAFIVQSRATGSRTIVSTRNGCRELSVSAFEAALGAAEAAAADGTAGAPAWCHLEAREMPSVGEMAAAYRRARQPTAARRFLSLEVEKPHLVPAELLPVFALCDVIFLSREFLERNQAAILGDAGAAVGADAEPLALRCLRALTAQVAGCRAMWVVGWGALGAYAFDATLARPLFQPAFPPAAVVDSVGAGEREARARDARGTARAGAGRHDCRAGRAMPNSAVRARHLRRQPPPPSRRRHLHWRNALRARVRRGRGRGAALRVRGGRRKGGARRIRRARRGRHVPPRSARMSPAPHARSRVSLLRRRRPAGAMMAAAGTGRGTRP